MISLKVFDFKKLFVKRAISLLEEKEDILKKLRKSKTYKKEYNFEDKLDTKELIKTSKN